METKKTYYYGIKYKVVKLSANKFFLLPVNLEGGLTDNVSFSTDHGEYAIMRNKNSFTNRYVISNIFYTEDLEKLYDYYDDTSTLEQVFFEDNREVILYVEVMKTGELKVYRIDTGKFRKSSFKDSEAIYYYEDEEAYVKLNDTICNKLLSCNDITELKTALEMYKKSIEGFKEMSDTGITRVDTINRKITSMGLNKNAEEGDYSQYEQVETNKNVNIAKKVEEDVNSDISKEGLYKAIRERVLGHDEEIKIIARRLYRNHIAKDGRKIKSILITGPSGTGKTETVKAAASYLNVPYVYANTADLVPTGIVGPKIEDYLIELFYKSGKNKQKAERGLFFLDEYDKLGNLEVKASVKPSLLSFNDGETISLPQLGKGQTFDTSRLNRLYSGVFERLEKNYRKMGFGNSDEIVNSDIFSGPAIKRAIIENEYFTKEDLGRISTFVRYKPLYLETKKDILRNVKSSALQDTIIGYKDDFGVDVIATEEFLDAFLNSIPQDEGMRDIGGYLDEVLDEVEEELCNVPKNKYKRLILKKDILEDHSKFDLS